MFLKCLPTVFVIEESYEILLFAKHKGILSVKVGNKIFYEENSGVLSSEKNFAKIRIPQKILDKYKNYTILYKRTLNRKAYFSEFDNQLSIDFIFRPLKKKEEIKIYHVADVHHYFENAIKTCSFFGNELDLLVVNGDIGELETRKKYFEIANFVGKVSKGEIPVIFARGNHDTRGKLVEFYTDYFPSNGKKTYFTFELDGLNGIVLDCGEDKEDWHTEYGGTNDFATFRKQQTNFLKKTRLKKDKISFAISHICPVYTTATEGGCFDIERQTYSEWNACLESLDIKFMLCGHFHKAFILDNKDGLIEHNYPVIVGSALKDEELIGTAIILCKDTIEVKFTDKDNNILFERTLII